jgi:hypothetical protein
MMATTAELTPRARFVFGLVAMAAGLAPMALATGFITPRPGSMRAPEWVVFLAGCTFFLAGWLILLPEQWVKIRGFLGGVLLTGFAAVFDWVAFGPGTRQFSAGLSIGPLSTSGSSSELTGRVVFGIAAASMSLFALWVWGRWLRSLFEPDSALSGRSAIASADAAQPPVRSDTDWACSGRGQLPNRQ